MEKIYNKLVRDNIPEIIESDDCIPNIKILGKEEYKIELVNKIKEEADELLAAIHDKNDMIKEISDIYEIIDTIINKFNLDKEEVLALQEKRKAKRGGFDKKIFLISVSNKED
jgi:predicted house-cleaning noncanonical NTP pyrophosphatase (MazG superfamily)